MRVIIRIIDPQESRAVEFPTPAISREAIAAELQRLRAEGARVYGEAVYGYVVYR